MMATEFTIPGFDRRYVLLPMLAAIALVTTAFFISEDRRAAVIKSAVELRDSQERMRMLAELAYAAADAESGQRGFLLTHDKEYLQPYLDADKRIAILVPELTTAYARNADELQHINLVANLIEKKLAELKATLEMADTTGSTAMSVRLVKTGIGMRWMTQVRGEIEGIRGRERERIYQRLQEWQRHHMINHYVAIGAVIMNIVLLLIAGAFITRDIERRTAAAGELDKLVAQRTAELSELSTHLQRVTEVEKSRLARELHDELGGLLVSIKMDLAQLTKKFDVTHPDVQPRWQRIQSAINAGVD